ncbi:unnamed protein product [Victoria cruziana]
MAGRSRVPTMGALTGREIHVVAAAARPGLPLPLRVDEMPPAAGRSLRPVAAAAALAEERLVVQHREIQALLLDNQRLAATHVALKQELSAAQQELRRVSHLAAASRAEGEARSQELFEKTIGMEAEVRALDSLRAELQQVRSDVQKLRASRQELDAQADRLAQDLGRARADVQQVSAIRAEIETMQQELQRGRAAVEYEKNVHAENMEQSQAMEKNMISMAREVEKLRAELANAEKRALAAAAAAAAANPGPGYGGNYGPDIRYGRSTYADGYMVHQGGVDSIPQYGTGGSSRGPYDA